MNLKIIVSESHDWYVVISDGEIIYEGHSIPNHVWVDVLIDFGVSVIVKEISDEDMEDGIF